MGNVCCKKPEDELVLETFDGTGQSNFNSKTMEKEVNGVQEIKDTNEYSEVKDKYPHDSDSAFKRQKHEHKENTNTNLNKQEIEPIIDEIGNE